MVIFYIVTKGKHPYGKKPDRLRNLLDGQPVCLGMLDNLVLKDLLSWMLSHKPEDRPTAEEALKHPYFQPIDQQFDMLCQVGNQPEINSGDNNSNVVLKLNSDLTTWRPLMTQLHDVSLLCSPEGNEKIFHYGPSCTECLRFIRDLEQYWSDKCRQFPQGEAIIDTKKKDFLKIIPDLPVNVHRIVRSCDWKERPDLKEYFM